MEPQPRANSRSFMITCLVLLSLVALLAVLLGSYFFGGSSSQNPTNTAPTKVKTIVVAGDIACEASVAPTFNSCRHADTAKLVSSLKPDAVLTVGDNQYQLGTLESYLGSYDKTWGAFKDITYPTPGNHEYYTPGAAGYFEYFGERAGERGKGYYSYKVGEWQLLALNSELDVSAGSEQLTWLERELNASETKCTLAYWHKPRFSTGGHESDPAYDALWRLLYANNVDIVVNGHSHEYERHVPQDPDGKHDPAKGIVQFISGMGGNKGQPLNALVPTLATRQNHAFGVLKFTLHPAGAQYNFVPIPGQQTFSDSGTITCH